jgi:hypothetical protein
MPHFPLTLKVLTTLALGAATLPAAAAAAPHSTVVLHKHVATAGVYDVAVTTRTTADTHVALKIGTLSRHATTTGATHHAKVTVKLSITRPTLTIRASTTRTTPALAVSIHRVNTTDHHRHHKPTPPTPVAPPVTPVAPPVAPPIAPIAPIVPPVVPPVVPVGPSPISSGPIGDPGSWHPIFDDEFNATTLDTSKWSTGWFGSGITPGVNSSEIDCYDPNQVVETSGELDLNLIAKPETCNGTTQPYASGIVTTNGKFSYTYGFYEARVWLPGTGTTIADWPAVWADGQSWPTDGELDTFEGLGGTACYHFHNTGGGPGGCAATANTYAGGWHTFGADWEPGSVTYYYDGQNVGNITTGITADPMYLILNLATSATSPMQGPATMHIDYVRVYQH